MSNVRGMPGGGGGGGGGMLKLRFDRYISRPRNAFVVSAITQMTLKSLSNLFGIKFLCLRKQPTFGDTTTGFLPSDV